MFCKGRHEEIDEHESKRETIKLFTLALSTTKHPSTVFSPFRNTSIPTDIVTCHGPDEKNSLFFFTFYLRIQARKTYLAWPHRVPRHKRGRLPCNLYNNFYQRLLLFALICLIFLLLLFLYSFSSALQHIRTPQGSAKRRGSEDRYPIDKIDQD